MSDPSTAFSVAERLALLERAQEVARVGSWVADLDGSGRLTWSAETYRILGLSPNDRATRAEALSKFVHPDDRDAVLRASRAAAASNVPYDIEHRILRPDGATRWVRTKADVVRDADGRPLRMVGTLQDITERRQLEEQVRQSQKLEAVGRLAGGVAHDINNSLTAIVGYTELALNALDADHAARPDVEEIRRAARRAESVTRQLLAFSRKQVLEPRMFSMADSIASLSGMLERLLADDITLTTEVPGELPAIYGDPGQIEQAILNLVINAKDAMPAGGRLSLALSVADADEAFALDHRPMAVGRYVQLSISDTGHGMDAATRARVFEPFFTTKEIGKGTGLGLAMVYGTVKQSGGFIFVESAPASGTTFRLYFPAAGTNQRVEARPAASAPERRHETAVATILVVEDEPPVRNLVVRSLTRLGHVVRQAGSADEALTVMATCGRIDLLLTDASMPGMSGIELAKRLARERPDMPIVIMSGFSDETLNLPATGLKAALLPKPFAPSDLERKLAEVLGTRVT